MSTNISRLVHALRNISAAAGYPLRPGPAEQLVAAALGFGTLASYQAAVDQQAEPRFLDDAEHIVIATDLLAERASSLAVGIPAQSLIALVTDAFEDLLPRVNVHKSVGGLEDFLINELNDKAANGHETSGPMAMTNNDGIGEIYLPFELDLDAVPVGDSELIEIDGHITMEVDVERPYSGHHIDVKATVVFSRLGRQIFREVSADILDAELSYDW